MSERKLRLLVIDNYDSFTYNLVQMFTRYDLEILVKRGDNITLEDAEALAPDYILISPGPKDPAHAGVSKEIIRAFYSRTPILGVCLGMQCLNEVFGGRTVRAPVPVHGKTDQICNNGQGLFKGMPDPFSAARYHSLMIEQPEEVEEVTADGNRLVSTAWTYDGIPMGVELPGFPVFGLQFHPESFLTEHGDILIDNFVNNRTSVFKEL